MITCFFVSALRFRVSLENGINDKGARFNRLLILNLYNEEKFFLNLFKICN